MTDTPARQPHPQRCETCGHWKKRHPESAIKTCEILDASKMTVIPIGESEITALVGCATHTSPRAHRTWESCHKHFACPDGEECWYWSADYYWDCGKGSARLIEGRIEAAKAEREQVLVLEKAWRADPHPSRDILNSFREICEKCVKDVGYEQEGCDPSDCLAQAQAEESLRAQQEPQQEGRR